MSKKSRYLISRVLIWIAMCLIFFGTSLYFLSTLRALETGIISATALVSIALLNEQWLFPKYYSVNRSKFLLLSFLLTVIIAGLYFGSDILIHDKLLDPEKRNIPLFFPILRAFSIVLLGNFISISILLANELKNNAEREKQLKEDKMGTEIKLLKAQINPHFIFNALNNIYSLTYTKSENAPESILKLSDMLRYVVYDCSKDHVKLDKEVEYIKNFIAFQQMKSDTEQNIKLDTNELRTNHPISAMLFIPFIENAFKYSNLESETDAFTNIVMKSDEKQIEFTIENSIPSSGKISSGNGTGISNVKKRLSILYLGKHQLEISEQENKYFVSLRIDVA